MVYRKVAKIFALFLFVWWGGMVKTAVSQSLPLPLADYWQHITELSNLVTSLRDAPIETQQTQLAAAAETLQNITAVSLPTGQTVPLDHTILLAKLKATPPRPGQFVFTAQGHAHCPGEMAHPSIRPFPAARPARNFSPPRI